MKNFEFGRIHPSVSIGDQVALGDNVTIGMNTIIYDNVRIGDNSVIGANCILGEPLADYYTRQDYQNPPLEIGADALIRSGSILYAGATIGPSMESGHRVTIREYSLIGHHFRIGNLCDVQGYCQIGNYVRLHSNVRIGQQSKIGDYVWFFSFTILTNDPYPPSIQLFGVTVEDYAVIATHSIIMPGVTIGRDSVIGAGSIVRNNVPPERLFVGCPAQDIASVHDVVHKLSPEQSKVYPWRYYFERGMPWEGIGYEDWSQKNNQSPTDEKDQEA